MKPKSPKIFTSNKNFFNLPSMASNNLIMEEREESMVSPTGTHSHFRKAHFLTAIDGAVVEAPPPQYGPTGAVPLQVNFRGWRKPTKNWESWVHKMHLLHHETWNKAGILDAIMNSIYIIHRNNDLIFGFSEKWCPMTNSFVFPWGEVTVTFEDMMILGGYSVLGDSILSPIPEVNEMEETLEKLHIERLKMNRSKAKKAVQNVWMCKFMMESSSEIEHEAFLIYWLSRFVFPISSKDSVCKDVFSIAVRLARGFKIALAPAVLACIYHSLSALQSALTTARKQRSRKGKDNDHPINIFGPLALVQVWVFERFPSLRPEPNRVRETEPRMARWHNLKKVVTKDIDSVAEDFEWRPYMKCDDNVLTRKIYMENENWMVVDDSDLDEELQGLIRCLRTSELVGLEPDCIEQYLPHRVAMQFGMDQDIPCHVARVNEDTDIAWSNYNRPIKEALLYVPPRFFESGVSTRYNKWWKTELENDDLIPLSELFPDRRNKKFMSRKVGKRQSTNGAEGASCGKDGGVKSSEMINIESGSRDSCADVSPTTSFAPKSKRKKDSKTLQDRRKKKFLHQKFAKRQKSPSSSEAENGSCGKGSSFNSSKKLCIGNSDLTRPVSPPPPLHSSPVKTWDLDSGSYGNKRSEDNGNIQEVTSLIVEPPETGIKNKPTKDGDIKVGAVEADHVQVSTTEEILEGLEHRLSNLEAYHVQRSKTEELWEGLGQRVRNLEKLCSLFREGKLNYLLVKSPNKP